MSTLFEDKDVLKGRRPDRLEDVEVPVRDQIVNKLVRRLEDIKFGEKAIQIWHVENANRLIWMERQQIYLANWDEFVTSSADGPFKGSSSLHLPVAFTICKTFHARMLQALIGVDPPFNVKARRADSIERSQLVEELMSYTLREWINKNKGIDEVADTFLWDWITTGVGILKTSWNIEFEKFLDVEPFIVEGQPVFSIDEQGNEVSEPTFKTIDREVERMIEKFRGPELSHVRPEDFVMAGGEGDPDKADMVFHRQRLTASKLWMLSDQKIFRQSSVKKVINAGPDLISGAENSNIKHQRSVNAGQSMLDTESDLDRYEILEVYASIDVDGSGINSEIVAWVHSQSREILRATYLNRVNKAGERPFSKIDFHKRPGQQFGIGMVEILHPLTTEIDAMHNLRIDYGMISTMPFGFYKPSSNIEAENIELEPGALIPVDDPQRDVFFPNLGNRTVFGFQEEQALQTMVERLTGISDLSLGVLSGNQGATRTATGARALVGEANANLDVHLRRLNRGWKRVLELILHMLQQRLPAGFEFRVTGENGNDYFAQIDTRVEIIGDFDFEISANSANSNKAIQQQIAQQILLQTSNPLDFQLGIISPGNRFEAIKNWYQALGVKEWSKFVNKPAGVTFQLMPGEELNRVIRGIQVEVVPQMDHQGFIDLWESVKQSEDFEQTFEEDQVALAESHSQRHQQMLQALESAASEQRNNNQQINNAANAQQQAPVGLNPFEGQ